MYHTPPNYVCPFCDWLAGNETEFKQKDDIVLETDTIVAFISPKWWINNPGHVIIIPKRHSENIYDIDDDTLSQAAIASKRIAQAIRKTYPGCSGISTRQHNEPDGNQNVWHFHTHVFPRYPNDKLYENHANKRTALLAERMPYAVRLRDYFAAESHIDTSQ